MSQNVRPQDLYRLPWSLTDNILSWLEPTKRCNLYCEGCYSKNIKDSDKTLDQVRQDMEVFTKFRNVDSISIAGGDPLVHPQIPEIVRMVRKDFGLKAIVNTNALALDDAMLDRLIDAGVTGFTFHIDSGQVRPGWKDKNEEELCELRLKLAKMVASRNANISVAFNCTVYPHTKQYIPTLVKWAQENIDIVASMVFILFRTTQEKRFDYYANGEKVDLEELVYYESDKNPDPVMAEDAIELIRQADPLYQPSSYLGGTIDPDSFKWLISTRFGTSERIHGYMGPKAMETIQVGHHALTGRYLGYSKPSELKMGRAAATGLAALDAGCRKAALDMSKTALKSPKTALKPVHTQSILVIQPIDAMADGRSNMCDGCPDMTVHEGKLVWSCRLDECKQYGTFLTAVPREGGAKREKLVQISNGDKADKDPNAAE